MKPPPPPPKHLRLQTRRWYTEVVTSFELAEHHRRILTTACEAWDRMVQARELLAKDGIVFANRFGELRPHPALAIERDSRIAFLRALRELALDVEAPDEDPRPPSIA